MPTQTTAPSPSVPPVLLAAKPTGTASDMSIALDFNTAMAAATGTIIITDGAVQTVIDRATGEPTLRVVGATDTHTVSAASLVIEGSHVTLDVTGLLPGHTYSVVMGADALQSSGQVAFGGVRSTSQLTFTTPAAADTQGPALVSVDTDGGVLKAGGSIAVTLKFSEAVANLPADALAAPHAGITNLSTSDGGITWHATLTAPADATTATGNVLSLDMSKVLDAAGNHGSGTSNIASYAVDTHAPTATVTLADAILAAGHDTVATIKFSEAVAGLSPDALNAGHATVSNLHTTDGGTTWVATLSGTAGTSAGDNVLAVDLGQVKDLAGNVGSGSAVSSTYTVDTQGPNAVSIALDGATLASGKAVHATFAFAERVQNLTPDAISAPHATVSNLVTSDGGKTWTATLNATGTGTWTGNVVTVDLTKVTDLAGNTGSGGGASGPYAVDTQGPSATLDLDGSAVHGGGTLGLTVHFSEAVTDLTTAALHAPNAALGNLQHSADYLTWTATLMPKDGVTDAANAVSLDLAQVHDAAGNAGSGSAASGNYAIDTQGPRAVTVALDGATLDSGNSIHATFTFDEAVQDLPLAALNAPHAHVTGLASGDGGKTWTATLTADGSGTWTGNAIGIDLTQVKDLAGNAGSGSFASAAYAVDTQGPGATLALDSTALHGGSSATLTIHFSEAVTDLTTAALQAPNATLTNLQHSSDGLTWTATLTPQGGIEDAGNAVTLDLTKVHDALGNAGSGSATSGNYTVDTQGPATVNIALDGTTLANGTGIHATFTFAQAVPDLPLAAISAPHATVSNLASGDGGKTWTALLSANGTGTWTGNTVGVDLTKIADGAGNAGSGSAVSAAYTVDTVAPAVANIALDNTNLDATHGATLTIRFSEAVADLDTGAITAPHAAISGLHTTDGGLTWSGTLASNDLTPSSGNILSVDLTRVHDLAGNAGSGSAQSDSYAVAGIANTLAITLDGASLDATRTIQATFTFTQAVRDLPLDAISAPHASVSNVAKSADGKTWTALLTASGTGDWTGNVVGVDLTRVQDLAGHAGTGNAWSAAYTVDTAGPADATIALGAGMLNEGGTMDVTFTFGESVSTLPATAISAPGATVSGVHTADGGKTWMATLTAQPGAEMSDLHVGLALTEVVDAHGNRGSGSATSTAAYAVDSKPPTVADILFDDTTIGSAHGIGFTITFSESVTGLTAAALQAPHATVKGLATTDGGKTWTGTLSADGSGTWTGNALGIDLTQVRDAAGNAGSGSTASLSHYDVNTTPLTATVALDGGTLVAGAGVGLTVSFSAPVTTLDTAAFTTPHSTLANLSHSTDYRTWYATLTTVDTGVVASTNAVSLNLAGVHDTLGNAGSGTAVSGNYTYDTTVAAYVSTILIADAGLYANDGITNVDGTFVEGVFIGSLTGSQRVKVTLDGQEIDQNYVQVYMSESGAMTWMYAAEGSLAPGVHKYTASIVDDAGHVSATMSKQFTLDRTAPNLTGSPTGNIAFDVAGNLVLTFDEAVYWKHAESVTDGLYLYNKTDSGATYIPVTESNFSSDHKTLTLTADELHLGSGNRYVLGLTSHLMDLAGNMVALHPDIDFTTAGSYVDVTRPTALSVSTSVYGGFYGPGATIPIRVTFSEPVNVTGAPVLHLNNGAVATFQSLATDHRSAVFNYAVAAGDADQYGLDIGSRADLAGHFADDAGNLLDLAHITFGNLTNDYGYGGTIQIDTHAPDAPSAPQLDASSDTGTVGDNITSNVLTTITGSGAEAGTTIELYVGDHLARSGRTDDDGHWTFTDVLLGTNGVYTLKAVQYDYAGNMSAPSQPLTITVAGSTAAVTTLAAGEDTGMSATDNITSHAQPVLTGTVAAGTEVTVWDGSTSLGSTTAGSDGVWHFTPLWSLAHGEHTIELELKDASGIVTARERSVPFTFSIDLFEPGTPGKPVLAASSDTGASPTDGITKDTTPTLTGTVAESGGQIEVHDGTTLLGKADVDAGRAWTFTLADDKALTDGVHTLTVRQVDAAGNASAYSAGLAITIDATAPTITQGQSATKVGENWYNLTFSEQIRFVDNGTINVLDSGGANRSVHAWNAKINWDLTGNTLGLDLKALSGSYHLAVEGNAIQDVAGNVAIIGSNQFDVGLLT